MGQNRMKPRIVIDGRKGAEHLHDGRNWYVEESPRLTPMPREALRNEVISFWVGFALFFSTFMAIVTSIAWIFS